MSTRLAPLNNLLKVKTKWDWTQDCNEAFLDIKKCLSTSPVLAHFDPNERLVVACDASPYGVAAVLSHRYASGSERPIAYASRTLSPAEKNYSQNDREALAVMFGVKKFQEYLFGKTFTLVTDSKALTQIYSPSKTISNVAASRVQRWAVHLGSFSYTVEHRSASKHSNVDGLSRLPVPIKRKDKTLEADIFCVSQLDKLPVTSDAIARETRKDSILSRVYKYTLNGWDESKALEENLKPFYNRRLELSLFNGIIMLGTRVVVPTKFRGQILDEIHSGHLGVVKMKSVARTYVYWPKIDQQIEEKARGCPGCRQVLKAPPTTQLHPWEWPSKPWRRLHIDFAGPYLDKMFLIVVDAHSKWPEVVPMNSATSASTIKALRFIFARFGLPQQIVSDNGAQFTSSEFNSFVTSNGIRHIRSAPFHPATNGLAERFVQSFKAAMKSAKASKNTVDKHLASFLIAYRNSSHGTTTSSPAMLLLGRPLRTRLDLLDPSSEARVLDQQTNQVLNHSGRNIEFEEGDKVLVRDYSQNKEKWTQATVTERTGPVSYKVLDTNTKELKRHCDQMLRDSNTNVPAPTVDTASEIHSKPKRITKKPERLIEANHLVYCTHL